MTTPEATKDQMMLDALFAVDDSVSKYLQMCTDFSATPDPQVVKELSTYGSSVANIATVRQP